MAELAMVVQQAKPTETKTKLEMNLGVRRQALGQLEQERMKLTLPAHSGNADAEAKLRQVRTEITEQTGVIEDVEQALRDIEPLVRAQRVSETLQHKREMVGQWDGAMAGLSETMERVDALLGQVFALVTEATKQQTDARTMLINLTMPWNAAAAHYAIDRMLAYTNGGFRSLPDMTTSTLKALFEQGRPDLQSAMTPAISQTKRAADQRIHDVMARHEREARAAGVEPPAEAEAEPVEAA